MITLILVYSCLLLYIFGLNDDVNFVKSEENIDTNSEGCGCAGTNRDVFPVDMDKINRDQSQSTDSIPSISRKLDEEPESSLFGSNSKMVKIKGGRGTIGTRKPKLHRDGEGPLRYTLLNSFYIDPYEVSNQDFAEFVKTTGFVTESEKFGWSFVFHSAIAEDIKSKITQAVKGAEWWLPVNGSYWREPEGPGTDVFATGRSLHPVAQVSYNDAVAFCNWRGARLPSEAEWEHAARGPNYSIPPFVADTDSEDEGGLDVFPWGNKLVPNHSHRANVFQGKFPVKNNAFDGYEYTAPVNAYGPQNDYGLYNMIGNVWEWVEDWFVAHHAASDSAEDVLINPVIDDRWMQMMAEYGHGEFSRKEKVKKGGSFLCHKSYCYRYRVVARFPSTPDSGTSNVGFRCTRSLGANEAEDADIAEMIKKAQEEEEQLDNRRSLDESDGFEFGMKRNSEL